jgi:hypothetical protein
MYNLALSVFALILLVTMRSYLTKWGLKLSVILVVCAVTINLLVAFKLHPDIKKIKQEIYSFEVPVADSPLRKKFGKLHAISASLNLLLLADALTLLLLGSVLKRQ